MGDDIDSRNRIVCQRRSRLGERNYARLGDTAPVLYKLRLAQNDEARGIIPQVITDKAVLEQQVLR